MKQKIIEAYMDTAKRFAQLSTAKRLQVGSIIVKDDRIISIGYNGTPAGWDNTCEVKEYMPKVYELTLTDKQIRDQYPFTENWYESFNERTIVHERRYKLTTKSEVIHAEANALAKLAKGNESGNTATMFLTHAPCIDCAKQIFAAGINKVYYDELYRSDDGINFLEKCNVEVIKT
jgi:dCMP deaminase